jgi:hypothetical protein
MEEERNGSRQHTHWECDTSGEVLLFHCFIEEFVGSLGKLKRNIKLNV